MSTVKNWMIEDNIKLFDEKRERDERLRQHVDAMHEAFVPKQHHVWCNFWNKPVETCKMCKGLYKNYPMGDLSEQELQMKHFPNAVRRA